MKILPQLSMTWHNQLLNNLEVATQSEGGLGGFHVQLPPKPTGQPCWWKFTFERNASNANVVPQLKRGDRWIHEDPRIPKINHWVIYLDSCLYLSMWSLDFGMNARFLVLPLATTMTTSTPGVGCGANQGPFQRAGFQGVTLSRQVWVVARIDSSCEDFSWLTKNLVTLHLQRIVYCHVWLPDGILIGSYGF